MTLAITSTKQLLSASLIPSPLPSPGGSLSFHSSASAPLTSHPGSVPNPIPHLPSASSGTSNPSSIIVGIDESGRGPVIGPLVIAALSFKESDIHHLEWLGVKDSKLLSREVRDELFERIRNLAHDFRIEIIEPDALDYALGDPSTNLNWLEAETQARLTSELDPDIVIIDCPSPNIAAYTEYFKNRLSTATRNKVLIKMEHRADRHHLPVAAASIIAKVLRDQAIDKICQDIGKDVGSGYPGDPKTKKFISENFQNYPSIFRKKWSTYKTIEDNKNQKTLGEF